MFFQRMSDKKSSRASVCDGCSHFINLILLMRRFSAYWPRLLLPFALLWFPLVREADSIYTSSYFNRPPTALLTPCPLPLPDLISNVISVSILLCCRVVRVGTGCVTALTNYTYWGKDKLMTLTVIVDVKINTWYMLQIAQVMDKDRSLCRVV